MHLDATDRQEINRWLAGMFLKELDQSALDLYRGTEGEALLDQLASVPALRPLVDELRSTIAGEFDTEVLRLDLAAAYGRLFLTGGPRAVPLHASAYLSENGLLMQAPAKDSAEILAQLGLVCPPGFREPADHIGIQLNILAEFAGGAKAEGLSEMAFLETRMMTWLPTFAALCARLPPVPFYSELGTATLNWLRATQAQLASEESVA